MTAEQEIRWETFQPPAPAPYWRIAVPVIEGGVVYVTVGRAPEAVSSQWRASILDGDMVFHVDRHAPHSALHQLGCQCQRFGAAAIAGVIFDALRTLPVGRMEP
jgi:hypothetical protein